MSFSSLRVNGRGLPSLSVTAGLALTWPAMMALERPTSGLPDTWYDASAWYR
ncbi:hypothetical protein D3C86_1945580 [compost metagenome]